MFSKSMEEFHFIHSYPELAFGKPKRDSRPALQKCTPMMSCVSVSKYISKNCVGRFRFIFLVRSHDNVNGRQTSVGNAGCDIFFARTRVRAFRAVLASLRSSAPHSHSMRSYEKIKMTEHTYSYTNFQMFVFVHHRFMVIIWLNCYKESMPGYS